MENDHCYVRREQGTRESGGGYREGEGRREERKEEERFTLSLRERGVKMGWRGREGDEKIQQLV